MLGYLSLGQDSTDFLPPPVLQGSAAIPSDVASVIQAQNQAAYQQAQQAAFRQGFAPAATWPQFVTSHTTALYVGLAVFAGLLLGGIGGRR